MTRVKALRAVHTEGSGTAAKGCVNTKIIGVFISQKRSKKPEETNKNYRNPDRPERKRQAREELEEEFIEEARQRKSDCDHTMDLKYPGCRCGKYVWVMHLNFD